MTAFNGTTGIDNFAGTNQADSFTFGLGELQSVDHVNGRGGDDVISFIAQGVFVVDAGNLVNVRDIEIVNFNQQNLSDISLTLPNFVVASSSRAGHAGVDTMDVISGLGDDTFDFSDVHAAYSLSLEAEAGDDLIIGGAADGHYIGEYGNDHLIAGTGIEFFDGNGHIGSHTNDADRDSVEGTAVAVDGDTYEAGDAYRNIGGETIDVTTAGTFTFTMSGFETVNLDGGANAATIDLTTFLRTITVNGASGNDTVTIQTPDGEDFFDAGFGLKLYGNGGDDHLNGVATGDTLDGGAGSDVLTGLDGDDRLYGGGLADILSGGDGEDRLFGGAGADFMSGGDEDDRYIVTDGDLILEFEDGGFHDVIETTLSKLTMATNVEDLEFTAGHRTNITGNVSRNTIHVGDKSDVVHAGDGDDIVYGGDGRDKLWGGEDTDSLWGEAGNDVLHGDGGDDYLHAGGGNDTIYGGDGIDTADFGEAQSGLTISAIFFQGTVFSAASTDEFWEMERVYGSDFDDTFASAYGIIEFSGGAGYDTLDLSLATENLDTGGAEHFIAGSGNDVMRGAEWAEGRDGNDKIYGGGGTPSTYDGGDGNDTVAYTLAQPAGTTHVDLGDNANNTGAAAGDTLISIENVEGSDNANDELIGDDHDNILDGHDGQNVLVGHGGDDTLIGGDGFDEIGGGDEDDTLIGGGGGDFLYGDDGRDTADYSDSQEGVTIELGNLGGPGGISVGDGFGGDAQGDYLENIENLTGSEFDDVLHGEEGDNALTGSGGDDALLGRDGHDRLNGGSGADTFIWSNKSDSRANNSHDIVEDFSHADGDMLDLSGIDAIQGHQDDAFHLTANGGAHAFTHDAGELRFVVDDGQTFVRGDVDGDGSTDFEIVLTGEIALVPGDFIL